MCSSKNDLNISNIYFTFMEKYYIKHQKEYYESLINGTIENYDRRLGETFLRFSKFISNN